ncbi:hypothetical protein CK203_110403 [Vitis vinifera]|uniref:Uncharacterized protein n=1 Tax=Vitis vinifera TaxID=29760 RepID=A0A438BP92_VITVI|nr:hypothetical protein CK203_110403 [Vitis vinifera]
MKNSMSRRTLVKESNTKKRRVGKNASKSSIEEEPRIVIKEDMMKKHMPPHFPQALISKERNQEFIRNSGSFETSEGFTKLGGKCEFAPYSVYKQLGLGELKPTAITLSLADSSHLKHDLGTQHIPPMQEASSPQRGGRIGGALECLKKGYLNPSDVLAIMSPWRRRKEILPLFNEEDSQGAAREDPPKLV